MPRYRKKPVEGAPDGNIIDEYDEMLLEGAPTRTLRESIPRILGWIVMMVVVSWFVKDGLLGMWEDVRVFLVGR